MGYFSTSCHLGDYKDLNAFYQGLDAFDRLLVLIIGALFAITLS